MAYQQYYAKYKNVRQTYEGYSYDSKFEASYAAELDLRKKAKDILDWEKQYKISIDISGSHICNYYCDFRVHHKDGSFELVETKGLETDVYRLKRKLMEAVWLPENLDHTYTVIKQKNYYRR